MSKKIRVSVFTERKLARLYHMGMDVFNRFTEDLGEQKGGIKFFQSADVIEMNRRVHPKKRISSFVNTREKEKIYTVEEISKEHGTTIQNIIKICRNWDLGIKVSGMIVLSEEEKEFLLSRSKKRGRPKTVILWKEVL